MFKVVVAAVLLAHGIGHSMGLLQIAKVATVNPAWSGDSWLLTGPLGLTGSQVIGGFLWTSAIVGFAALAAVVVGWLPVTWFQPVAVGSAIVSLAGLVLFPVAFPTFSTIGAFLVDAVLLAATVWYGWVPADQS